MKTGPEGRVFVAYSPARGCVWWTHRRRVSKRKGGGKFLMASVRCIEAYAKIQDQRCRIVTPRGGSWLWLRDCLREAQDLVLEDNTP